MPPEWLLAQTLGEHHRVAGWLEDSRDGQKPHAVNASHLSAVETLRRVADGLRAAFDGPPAYTVGVEEEVMLLSPRDLGLAAVATEVLGQTVGDSRFKLELPASQLEIVCEPAMHVGAIDTALRQARSDLAERCSGLVSLGAAGVHPFSPGVGELNRIPRYEHLTGAYRAIAARQLVCALQVHVAVGDSDRALGVYNALRSYLPLLAALAANGPFYEGADTGFASVRPKLSELLPRQGIPPSFSSWGAYARALAPDTTQGRYPDLRTWWWELRLHPRYGTLELRVPDSQSTVTDAVAIAAVAHCLVAWLGDRYDSGDRQATEPSWRIEQNRWSAARHGVEGTMMDLQTGARRSTRTLLHELLDALRATATRLRATTPIGRARELIEANGAILQRRASARGDAHAAARWLVERFQE
jgi:carboxylate-amine ligase